MNNQLTQKDAIQIMCNALVLALRRGAFQNFDETREIDKALSLFIKKTETTETTETPVVNKQLEIVKNTVI